MHTQTHQHTCIHTHTFLCSSYFIQIGRPPFELKSLLWKHTPNGAHQEGQGSCRRAKTEARGRFVRWVFDLFLSGECWSFEISNSTLHVRVLLIIWDLTAQMSMCGFCWSFEILQLRCSSVGFADHLRSYSSTVHVWVLLIIWDLTAQMFMCGFCWSFEILQLNCSTFRVWVLPRCQRVPKAFPEMLLRDAYSFCNLLHSEQNV
jgi:hypothetical protein